MSIIKGITIRLEGAPDTKFRQGNETKEHLYLGVKAGTSGGIEFPIDNRSIKTFEAGVIYYNAGIVPPDYSGLENAHPCRITENTIDFGYIEDFLLDSGKLDGIYLRKNGSLTFEGDDAYKLKSIEVSLHSEDVNRIWRRKIYSFPKLGKFNAGIYLSNENGLKVWLRAGSLLTNG